MITVSVRQEDCIDLFKAQPGLVETTLCAASTKPGIDEKTRCMALQEGAVSAASAPKDYNFHGGVECINQV